MKQLLVLTCFMFALVFTQETQAQKFSGLDKSPADIASFPTSYRVADKAVKVVYSRPQLKGRSLSDLAPDGKVWRTGANECAEITFYKDANFGGQSVKEYKIDNNLKKNIIIRIPDKPKGGAHIIFIDTF